MMDPETSSVPNEETQALLQRNSSETSTSGRDPETASAPHSHRSLDTSDLWTEAKRLMALAGPLTLQDILVWLQSCISIAFVGRIDSTALSILTLTTTTFNITGLSIAFGMASGAETLSGQCYGARNYAALGVTLQKSLLICYLTCLLVFGLWTQAGRLLTASGQDHEIARAAMNLLWYEAPALFFIATTECLKRYLMAQSIVLPTCVINIVSTCLAPLLNWVLIFVLGWGLKGAVAAFNITSACNCLGLLLYIMYHTHQQRGSGKETWHGWSRECFSRWGEYFGLAVPAMIMMCLEWWCFEAITLMTGTLPQAAINLGVTGILFEIGGLTYMLPIGFQGASSTRVANELGEGRPLVARKVVHAGLCMGACTQILLAVALVAGRSIWGYFFTSDPEVVNRVAVILPIMACMVIFDGCNAVCSGAIRGCGRQMLAAIMNLTCFWGIGLPVAAILAYKTTLQTRGLWMGVALSLMVQFVANMTLLSILNWQKEAQRAAALVEGNKSSDDRKRPLLDQTDLGPDNL